MTLDALFKLLGGPAEIGRGIGVPTEHAGLLKARRSIPIRYWRALMAMPAALEAGIAADDLLSIHLQEDACQTPLQKTVPTDIPSQIVRIQAELNARNIPLSRLLVAAKVDRSTLHRWRAGTTEPQLAVWRSVVEAADRLIGSVSLKRAAGC